MNSRPLAAKRALLIAIMPSTISRLRRRTPAMSTVQGPRRNPNVAAWRTKSTTLALWITFLLGRQAMLGHEPPISARSTTATRCPPRASSQAMYLPASPPPEDDILEALEAVHHALVPIDVRAPGDLNAW